MRAPHRLSGRACPCTLLAKLWSGAVRQTLSHLFVPPLCHSNLQELVKDGNKRHATVVLDLAGRRCRYQYNRPDYFFQCRLLALDWLRDKGLLR